MFVHVTPCAVYREIVMPNPQVPHGYIKTTGYSVAGCAPFISMKAAQWRIEGKMAGLLRSKIPGSDAVLPHHLAHRASALETNTSQAAYL